MIQVLRKGSPRNSLPFSGNSQVTAFVHLSEERHDETKAFCLLHTGLNATEEAYK